MQEALSSALCFKQFIRERMVGQYRLGQAAGLREDSGKLLSRMGPNQVSKKLHPAISNLWDPKSLKPGKTGIPEIPMTLFRTEAGPMLCAFLQ